MHTPPLGVVLMGLLDSLEKLLNEHGSAVILKERIAQLNQQHDIVVRQRDELRAQVARLEVQVQAARAQIDEVRRAQHQADEQRQRNAAQAAAGAHLNATDMQALAAMAAQPGIDSTALAAALGMSAARTALACSTLEASGFATATRYPGFASMNVAAMEAWACTTPGLRLLDERGMLP